MPKKVEYIKGLEYVKLTVNMSMIRTDYFIQQSRDLPTVVRSMLSRKIAINTMNRMSFRDPRQLAT